MLILEFTYYHAILISQIQPGRWQCEILLYHQRNVIYKMLVSQGEPQKEVCCISFIFLKKAWHGIFITLISNIQLWTLLYFLSL